MSDIQQKKIIKFPTKEECFEGKKNKLIDSIVQIEANRENILVELEDDKRLLSQLYVLKDECNEKAKAYDEVPGEVKLLMQRINLQIEELEEVIKKNNHTKGEIDLLLNDTDRFLKKHPTKKSEKEEVQE